MTADRQLAAASLIRAFLADDRPAGMLILEQNADTPDRAAAFCVEVVTLTSHALLAANGYDIAKTLAVIDAWMTRAADAAAPP